MVEKIPARITEVTETIRTLPSTILGTISFFRYSRSYASSVMS